MENGLSMKSNLQDKLGVSQPASLSTPYPQFVNSRSSHGYSVKIPQVVVLSKFDAVMSSGASTNGLPVKRSSIMPLGSKKNLVSRPVRHFGPPPGFGSVPSKVVDEPLYSDMSMKNGTPIPQIDDYSWLDGYQLSSSNQSVGFSNSMNHMGHSFPSMSKSNGPMGISTFPFHWKQVQSENQIGWQDNPFVEQMLPY
ncbi:hypothetical protein ACS0TY_027812 [Phlomoides rotata]